MKKLLLIGLTMMLLVSCKNESKQLTEKGQDIPTVDTVNDTLSEENPVAEHLENIEFSCESGIFGIDISDHEKNINWEQVGSSGISFIYIKATDGISFDTQVFKEQWESINATNSNIIRGAYHFFEYKKADRVGQAQFYIKTVLPKYKAAGSTLPPVVDLEYLYHKKIEIPVPDIAIFQQDVLNWLQAVETAFGRRPMIYTNSDFANTNLDNEEFGNYPIWIADWANNSAPDLPKAWKGKSWVFWQKGKSFPIQRVEKLVDLDCFNGTLEDLKKL